MRNPRLAVTAALLGLAAGVLAATGPAASATPPATAEGRLEVVHEDHFDVGRADHRYTLVSEVGRRTELLFDDAGPHELGARDVRVTGTPVRPGVLRVGSTSAVAETGTEPSGPVADGTATPTTLKKVAVILYDFANSAVDARPVDVAQVRDTVFTTQDTLSVNDYLAESSYGQLQMTGADGLFEGDVFDWVRISASSTDSCAYSTWGKEARERAAGQGFVDAAYDQVIHLMPKSTCGFGGLAYMPGKYSWTVLRAKGSPNVLTRLRGITSHEYGHNLGIHHSGSATCTSRSDDVVTLGTCTARAQYGDPFSVMGSSLNERQYTGYQKGRLGWLSGSDTLSVTSSGTYTLSTASLPGAGPKVLRIAAPKVKGSSRFYYAELRTPHGSFDSASSAPGERDSGTPVTLTPVTGLQIRYGPDYRLNAVSDLYDMTPETPAFTDAALPVGHTFSAPAVGMTLRLVALTDTAATVTVTLGGSGGKGSKK